MLNSNRLIAVQMYLKIIIYWHKTQGLILNFLTAHCAEPHSPYNLTFDLHYIKHHIISPYLPWSKFTFPQYFIVIKFRPQSVCLSSPNPRHTPTISQLLHFSVLSTSDQYKSRFSQVCTLCPSYIISHSHFPPQYILPILAAIHSQL